MLIGEKIKHLIKFHGHSATEMAEQIGITNPYLYKMFKMESVDTKYLERIAKVLKIPITTFFEDEETFGETGTIPLNQHSQLQTEVHEPSTIHYLIDTIEAQKKLINILEEDLTDKANQLEIIHNFLGPYFEKLEPYFKKEELRAPNIELAKIRLKRMKIRRMNP